MRAHGCLVGVGRHVRIEAGETSQSAGSTHRQQQSTAALQLHVSMGMCYRAPPRLSVVHECIHQMGMGPDQQLNLGFVISVIGVGSGGCRRK
jgi:hypothetical protein